MFGAEQQKNEIETIRERNIKLKLSDADCDRVSKLCGEHNITVAELLENFIGDLVGGTYTNGSDERDFADRYFRRCWFGMFPVTTLLSWLLSSGYEVYDDFLSLLGDVENGYAELEDYEKNPSSYDEEEIGFLRTDITDWEEQIKEIKTDFLCENKDADWETEVENVKQWFTERARLING